MQCRKGEKLNVVIMPNPVLKYLDLEPCRLVIYIRYLFHCKLLEEG